MKVFIWSIFLIIIISNINYSQTEDGCAPEIYIATVNIPSQYFPLKFHLEKLSNMFCHDIINGNLWFPCNSCDESPEVTLSINFPVSCNSCGWTICVHDLLNNCNTDNYGYGLYKVTSEITNRVFYIDMRDCNYWQYLAPGYGRDLWIKYDWNNGDLLMSYRLENDWLPLVNNDLLTMWDINNIELSKTSCFENFWENCLILIPSESGNHPRLVWGSYPADGNYYYKIYKKSGTGNFAVYDSTYSLNYTDVSETISQGPHANETIVYYKITSVARPHDNPPYPYYESGYSNSVNITVLFDDIDKISIQEVPKVQFFLDQNYPNPFNPVTEINYSIDTEGLVSLKIYDILGKEIAELVKDFQPAGNYSVTFNALNLPSGIYIYKLVSNNFSCSRKLQLIK